MGSIARGSTPRQFATIIEEQGVQVGAIARGGGTEPAQ
jgi:hypothetical protein